MNDIQRYQIITKILDLFIALKTITKKKFQIQN
jgi:hypothetical protein